MAQNERRVKVLDNGLVATKSRYNLDETGHMLKMQGRIFIISNHESGRSSLHIYCEDAGREFIFDAADYKIFDMNDKEHRKRFPRRKPETFNPAQLDL